ncbi:TPA: response regulator [Vibrio cholerae]|nr:response regulator [Vibrio cholerae]HDI3275975.1 response regulator [Vibrio cholerae]
MNVLIVSEYPLVRELLRSSLKPLSYISYIHLSSGNDINFISKNFDTSGYEIVIYDLDSAKKSSENMYFSMLNTINDRSLVKHGFFSLIVLASDTQVRQLKNRISFCEDYMIKKPFTFRCIEETVKHVLGLNLMLM